MVKTLLLWKINTKCIFPHPHTLNISFETTIRFGAGTAEEIHDIVDQVGRETPRISSFASA